MGGGEEGALLNHQCFHQLWIKYICRHLLYILCRDVVDEFEQLFQVSFVAIVQETLTEA